MVRAQRERPLKGAAISQPQPLRPSLRQRISSFMSLMQSLPIRKFAARQRPKSAPDLRHTLPERAQEDLDPLLSNRPQTSNLSDNRTSDQCPNDPSVYYSFPSIEKNTCRDMLCGFCRQNTARPPATTGWLNGATDVIRRCSSSRPCTPARAGQSCGHLASDNAKIGSPGGPQKNSRLSEVMDEQASHARVVSSSPAVSSSRPKRASMPRFSALSALNLPAGTASTARPPTRRGPIPERDRGLTFDTIFGGSRPTTPGASTTPSPKLHHILGSEGQPFVSRDDAQRYLATIQTDGQSPGAIVPGVVTTASIRPNTALVSADRQQREYDVSQPPINTVFYPRAPLPVPGSPTRAGQAVASPEHGRSNYHVHTMILKVSPARLHSLSTSVAPHLYMSAPLPAAVAVETIPARGAVSVDSTGRPVAVNLELQVTGQDPTDRSGAASPAETPSTLGGKKLELRGGAEEGPHLRGGGRSDTSYSVTSLGKRLKGAFSLCGPRIHPPVSSPSNDLPPIRVRKPYTNPLSSGCARSSLPGLRGGDTSKKQKRALYKGNFANTSKEQLPRLRGGGGNSGLQVPKLNDNDTLPVTLWFLAGGRGKAITVEKWKKQKPKKRMGGLLGMAIYGNKAGRPYEEEDPAEDKPAEDKPAEDKPAEDKPAEDKPAEDKPAEYKPAEDNPAEDKPAEDKPGEEKPAEENSGVEKSDDAASQPMIAIQEKQKHSEPEKDNGSGGATTQTEVVPDGDATQKDKPLQVRSMAQLDVAPSKETKQSSSDRKFEAQGPTPKDNTVATAKGAEPGEGAAQTNTARLRGGGKPVTPPWDLGLLD